MSEAPFVAGQRVHVLRAFGVPGNPDASSTVRTVKSIEWDDELGDWFVELAEGDAFPASVVVAVVYQVVQPPSLDHRRQAKAIVPHGGPVFPCYDDSGMTLRDFFAAQALVGCCDLSPGRYTQEAVKTLAGQAYGIADAMLVERAKGGDS